MKEPVKEMSANSLAQFMEFLFNVTLIHIIKKQYQGLGLSCDLSEFQNAPYAHIFVSYPRIKVKEDRSLS